MCTVVQSTCLLVQPERKRRVGALDRVYNVAADGDKGSLVMAAEQLTRGRNYPAFRVVACE